MSGCTDKRFAQMLYAYELGMLSDEEQRELELHLLDCDDCFHNVAEFRRAAGLIRNDPEVRETVDQVTQKIPETSAGEVSEDAQFPARRKWLTIMTPVLAAAALILILLLTNWEVVIRPTPEVVAVENRLAVMYFHNLTDEADTLRFGEIAANLLITDLSESHYLQVVSSQRLYDILRLLDQEGIKVVDRETASEVARQARAEWLLTGDILQVEPHFEITAQLVEMPAGNVISAQRVSGAPGEDIFSLIDKLSIEVKKDLALPSAVQEEPDRRVADVTTHSSEAYRHYLEGVRLWWKYYREEAAASFYKAIQLDSTFAMAYFYLSQLADRSYITQAVKYAENTGRLEQYYIHSHEAALNGDYDGAIDQLQQVAKEFPDEKEAYYRMGLYAYNQRKFEEAARYFNQAVALDPLYTRSYNYLAYTYDQLGEYEKAIEAINEYIALAPDEPNPYDTKGDICARNGRVEPAVEAFRKALAIKPNFPSSMWNLAHLQLQVQEYAEADSIYNAMLLSTDVNVRSAARLYMPYTSLSQGKFTEALRIMDQGIAADRAEQPTGSPLMNESYKHFLKAWTYAALGDYDRALQAIRIDMDIQRSNYPQAVVYHRHYYAQILAESGAIAEAEAVADSLKKDLERPGYDLDTYWLAAGFIEFARGNPDGAIENFEKIADESHSFDIQFYLARAYLDAGRLAAAVALFEEMSKGYSTWRAFCTIYNIKVHYYLGIAYEESRWTDRAVEQYETFLTIWKNADPGIPEVEDAKARLARLHSL